MERTKIDIPTDPGSSDSDKTDAKKRNSGKGITGGTTEAPMEAAAQIAGLLVEAGHIDHEQLRYALRVRAKLPKRQPVIAILEELGHVTADQIRETLRDNRLNLRLGTLLYELGLIDESGLRSALAIKEDQPEKRFGEILLANHFVTEDDLLNVLSMQLGFTYLTNDRLDLAENLISLLRPRWFQKAGCVPVLGEAGQILLVMRDPLDTMCVAEAEEAFGSRVTPSIARSHAIDEAIGRILAALEPPTAAIDKDNLVVTTVDRIIREAIDEGASDIHIEPLKERLRVRYRLDGVLHLTEELPRDLVRPIASRIKILCGADIAERRRHQGGRLLYEHDGMKIDTRVSFYSTVHGEKIVLRLLNNRSSLLDIQELGMAPRMFDRFREEVLEVPSGVVLVTGPTGSGKTTTLYGAVNYLNDSTTSIITAEDPVEYVIEGTSQCSINPKINITYEETLRHIVRQDPDIIVIGEIRDRFSADTAVQAALTGHKVLTTFHTEDSIGGLLRLLHMDIEAFLISSTVVCVVAQRLMRRVCPHCAEEYTLTPDEIRRLGYNPADLPRLVFFKGSGCGECRYRGYRGRTAVFELLILDELVRDALIHRRTSYEIRRICAESTGLVTLLEDGIVKATQGLVTYEEIIRCLPRLSKPRPLADIHRLLGVNP